MISRIVEVSIPGFLSLKDRQLVVEKDGEVKGTIPIEDLGVLILDHPALVYTHQLFQHLAEHNVAVVLCDAKHMPTSLLLNYVTHHEHTKVLRSQISCSPHKKTSLWRQIVQAKIERQSRVLQKEKKRSPKLEGLAQKVTQSQTDLIEARAAHIYFHLLFGKDFDRDPKAPGINSLLNYGYAIIRAAIARAIVGTGMHPALGIHHRNPYNPFCLADDLMEPLRPLVDQTVYRLAKSLPEINDLTPALKREILSITTSDLLLKKRKLPFMTAIPLYVAGVKQYLCENARKVEIPLW
ncbi:MAG TPA: type II CRISPR-associated endonuclease Cas1 [Fimbriimonadales bacterium]|nr:type II CRISPR-associated endonuclease Cas1 [Fimbriimonadales bacterium]